MVYKCSVCGYVYDEEKENKPFSELECCPICKQPADKFKPDKIPENASVMRFSRMILSTRAPPSKDLRILKTYLRSTINPMFHPPFTILTWPNGMLGNAWRNARYLRRKSYN